MVYNYSHRKALQQSDEIAHFQRRINFIREKLGGKWKYLSPDGIYGRGTRDAVKQFQEFARQFQGFDNVVVNGQLDDVSQSAVNKLYQHALQNTLPPRKPGQQHITSFKPLYMTPYAAYSGVTTNGPPPKISHNQPVVDTSSIIDSEWKSLGKDILDITEEVAKYMVYKNVNSAEAARQFIEQQLKARNDFLQNLIKRKENTFNAFLRRELMVGKEVFEVTQGFTPTMIPSKTQQYQTFLDCMNNNKQNVDKARQMFVNKAMGDMKKAADRAQSLNVIKNADKTIEDAAKSASKWGTVAKGAKIGSWSINIGTSLYYGVMMATSDSKEEFDEYADKLGNSLGTTAVDVGLSFGGSLAVRFAGGAAGGPAGIVVASLYTVLDVVSLCVTGESISSHIWNFLKSLSWSEGFKGYNAVKRDNKGIMWI